MIITGNLHVELLQNFLEDPRKLLQILKTLDGKTGRLVAWKKELPFPSSPNFENEASEVALRPQRGPRRGPRDALGAEARLRKHALGLPHGS